jgi:hypothetical protein
MVHITTGTSHMMIRLLLITVALLPLVGRAQAAPIEMVFPEGTYQSGSPLLFSVVLPTDISDLGAYEIQIVITGDDPTAGVDYGFDVDATKAANSNYVFESTDLYFDAVIPDSATSQILVLSDLTLGSGVDVSPDVNDRVADVVVHTSASYSGSLTFSIDVDALILDTPVASDIAPLATIRSDTAAAGPITITVPEPSAVVPSAVGICAMVLGTYRSRRRRL